MLTGTPELYASMLTLRTHQDRYCFCGKVQPVDYIYKKRKEKKIDSQIYLSSIKTKVSVKFPIFFFFLSFFMTKIVLVLRKIAKQLLGWETHCLIHGFYFLKLLNLSQLFELRSSREISD